MLSSKMVKDTCVKLNVEDVKVIKKDNATKDLSLLKQAILTKGIVSDDQSASDYEDDEIFWAKIPVSAESITIQDFNEIRTRCLAEGKLFEDPEFPLKETTSLTWKRPLAISKEPKLFVNGVSRFDVQQGHLGDCWLHAAIANLSLNKKLFSQVVPDDQSFDKGQYAGVFHFRFWQFGEWVDVIIDDRLPTSRYNGQLIFGHSSDSNEFWCALLEKAYAKLCGSYEVLIGGITSTALLDFTGGVIEKYYVGDLPTGFYETMLHAYERHALIAAGINPDSYNREMKTPTGLVTRHAYTISAIKNVTVGDDQVQLLRIRNPWGAIEWNGPWSDNSSEWNSLTESDKYKMGVNFDNDGEFWMSYQDFCKYFSDVNIANLDSKYLDSDAKTWEMSLCKGEWIKGLTAGGCGMFLGTFWRNPQYTITLTGADDGDQEGMCTVIVDLIQNSPSSKKNDVLIIGLYVYRLSDNNNKHHPLQLSHFFYNQPVASAQFVNARQVNLRHKLSPGTYVIIPTTFQPDEEGQFLLRVFSEKNNHLQQIEH